ncbi:MAG: IS5 family transposase [Acidimicrobiales bacterium]
MIDDRSSSGTWRSAHGDMSDEEWELIADLVEPYSSRGRMGRPAKHARRDIVDAIFYVTATGCQWRALPSSYPHWNTVHRYHLRWSRDGTWEQICGRLNAMVREHEGRDPTCSGSVIDARSVRGAATVTSATRGYDAGKKVSGRKTFGVVDTLGLLVAVVVVAASTSDNAGGITVIDRARRKTRRLKKVFCDGGFKRTFIAHCAGAHLSAEVVRRIATGTFEVLPRRWVVERTWSWLMNNRRLQVDYERDPVVTEGFIWAAHSRLLLRRLTSEPVA